MPFGMAQDISTLRGHRTTKTNTSGALCELRQIWLIGYRNGCVHLTTVAAPARVGQGAGAQGWLVTREVTPPNYWGLS